MGGGAGSIASLRSNRVLDKNGKSLLDLCRANGRIGEDAHVGDYTFTGDNGRSVIDY